MILIKQVCNILEELAPLRLAEEWDNVGLILGDPELPVRKVMTCLTVTPESAQEAIAEKADLIVSHHPLPFRKTRRITTESTATKLVWELARAGVSIYSPHTAFDSTVSGINAMLCERLGVGDMRSLIPNRDEPEGPGAGRVGKLSAPQTLLQFAQDVKSKFALPKVHFVGDAEREVHFIATACGSGGTFLEHAVGVGADVLVTGEATFHTVLEARASGIGMILMGHYFSERFAVEALAEKIGAAIGAAIDASIDASIGDVEVWASRRESNPVETL